MAWLFNKNYVFGTNCIRIGRAEVTILRYLGVALEAPLNRNEIYEIH